MLHYNTVILVIILGMHVRWCVTTNNDTHKPIARVGTLEDIILGLGVNFGNIRKDCLIVWQGDKLIGIFPIGHDIEVAVRVVWSYSTEGWDIDGSKARNVEVLRIPIIDCNLSLIANKFHTFVNDSTDRIGHIGKLLANTLIRRAIHLETRPIDQHTGATLHICDNHTLCLSRKLRLVVESLAMVSDKVDNLRMVRDNGSESS